MRVYLVDGTYELFRHYFAVPSYTAPDGSEVAAVRGVAGSVIGMIEGGATHLGVATDHVVESFRNELWPGYKTGADVAPDLLAQFQILEDVLSALGIVIWPMEDYEADDALASAACAASDAADQVLVCTPDKDLAQSVVADRVVQLDRRSGKVRDEAGVIERFGVEPASIPDYLALVGDSADGFPGLAGWGAKSAALVLAHYRHIEAIPDDVAEWEISLRGAARLAATLAAERDLALLFKDLATLRDDLPLFDSVDALRWTGPAPELPQMAERLGWPALVERVAALEAKLSS